MSRFLRTLAKVGLVELDPHEAQAAAEREPAAGPDEERLARILDDAAAEHSPVAAPPATLAPDSPANAAAQASGAIVEGVSFEDMYAGAEVPVAPYAAEKLLKLLDGLRAMDAATRKAAIMAMDAADDAWTLDDVILDAERKCRALGLGIERVQAQSAQVEERVKGELVALDRYTEQATATIKRQIAELEALLQQELQKAAARRAELQMDVRGAREAAARERARYEQEMGRLREISRIFAPSSSSSG